MNKMGNTSHNCMNSKWRVIIVYSICLVGVIIFAKGFFPMKSSSERHADHNDILPEPSQPDVIAQLLEEDFNKVTKFRSTNASSLKAAYKKLVLVVIDAMREDFIRSPTYNRHMPFLQQVLEKGDGIMFTAKAKAPTVTMPRLKALMTGDVPGYIDVVLNLEQSAELKADNIISGLHNAGKKMIFYGDETWLRLFPHSFVRSDGTTSFFVTDYTEVDQNVTRHLKDELYVNKDWDVMILHYLGLDHIGHLAGPSSPLMPDKLREMDSVIKTIYSALEKQDNALLVVTSDHGMSSQGSHGGTTHPEIDTPLLFLSPNVNAGGKVAVGIETVEQTDFAATISLLMGIPIPVNSVGKAITPLLKVMNKKEQLHAMQHNCHQLLAFGFASGNLPDSASGEKSDPVALYRNGVQFHSAFLSRDDASMFDVAMNYYVRCQRLISAKLTSTLSSYNYFEMGLGIIILLTGLCGVLGLWIETFLLRSRRDAPEKTSSTKRITRAMIALAAGFLLFIITLPGSSFVEEEQQTWYFLTSSLNLALSVALLRTMATRDDAKIQQTSTKSSSLYDAQIREGDAVLRIRKVASMKNETWQVLPEESQGGNPANFAEGTRDTGTQLGEEALVFDGSKPIEKQSSLIKKSHRKYIVITLLFLLLHRLMRSWNQTGIKHADVPDIGDWLNLPQNRFLLRKFSVFGLLSIFLLLQLMCTARDLARTILSAFGLIGVYWYRLTIDSARDTSNTGLYEARLVYLLVGILLTKMLYHCVFQLCINRSRTKSHSCTVPGFCPCSSPKSNELSLDCLQSAMVLLATLLLRPHNHCVLAFCLILYWILYRVLWPAVVENHADLLELPLSKLGGLQQEQGYLSAAHLVARITLAHWFGQTTYFALGNSNGFATVDLSAAYVGLSGSDGVFHFLAAGFLGIFSTYVGPILWTTFCVCDVIKSKLNEFNEIVSTRGISASVNVVTCTLAALRLFTLTIYVAVATGHRYHLFVWSVFSPKLLYEIVSTAMHGVLLVGITLLW